MHALIGAALGQAARRLLLLDPPLALAFLAQRSTTTLLVVASSRRRLLRSWRAALAERHAGAAAVALVAARADALPFARPRLDAVVAAAGVPSRSGAVAALRSFRRLLRPGGALMVASRLREGDLGVAASLARRLASRQALPTAAELATWMLVAGLREVRQARPAMAVVPAALTWATARPSPWLDAAAEPQDEIATLHEEPATPGDAPEEAPVEPAET